MLKSRHVNLIGIDCGNIKTSLSNKVTGWCISGIEKNYCTLNCTVGERKFYVSANRPLAEKLKNMSDRDRCYTLGVFDKIPLANINTKNLKIIPLYKNCIFDEVNEKDIEKGDESHCIYINSKIDIGTIQFKNCTLVTPIISDTNDNKETHTLAFIIRTEKDKPYTLKVFTMDKTVYNITEDNIETTKVNHDIRKPMVSLHGPKYIVVPNKAYFTNDNVKNVRAGMISVKANDIINTNNIIRVNRKKAEFVYGIDLSCEEIIMIKTRLGILPKPKQNLQVKNNITEPIVETSSVKHNKEKYNNKPRRKK